MDDTRRFPRGSKHVFFERDHFDAAVEALSAKVRSGEAADVSWLPYLVEVGGFEYEGGRRDYPSWSVSVLRIAGDSAQSLLREAWMTLPRCVVERFVAVMDCKMSEFDRSRFAQSFKNLQRSFAGSANRGAGAAPSLEALQQAMATVDAERHAEELEQMAGEEHRHLCENCGVAYVHHASECEPPDDAFCPLCAEQFAGPAPVWIERWTAKTLDSLTGSDDLVTAENGKAAVEQPAAASAQASEPACAVRGFAAVAGMDELKALLLDEVVAALRDPEDFIDYGLTIPNGILLFGPPGCGKTYISQHLAEEMGYYYKELFPSEIGGTFIHETALKIREAFDSAAAKAPAILFIDEFESMVPARRNLGSHQQHTAEEVSEFLKQLENCAERKILLIAATNEPWKIDPAVQRTGRLDKKIYVGAPDAHARAAMLAFHLRGRKCGVIDVSAIGEPLVGYSASDIKLVVDEAARMARKERVPIEERHLCAAAKERVQPSVTPQDEARFLSFGQRGVNGQAHAPATGAKAPVLRGEGLLREWLQSRRVPKTSEKAND